MGKNTKELGKLSEIIAADYLRANGYRIIERNYMLKFGEIDIVARHKNNLVFVEVRSRTGERFGIPEESINRRKRVKLLKCALAYVKYKEYKGMYRIDFIGIVFDKNMNIQRRTHYTNIITKLI